EQALRRTLANDAQHEGANFLLEQLLAAKGAWDAIAELHERRAFSAAEEDRARLHRRFASIWAVRWNDAARSAAFYRRALESYYQDGADRFPGHIAACELLRDAAREPADWESLLELAEQGLAARIDETEKALLAAQAGAVAWRHLNDPARAKALFARAK